MDDSSSQLVGTRENAKINNCLEHVNSVRDDQSGAQKSGKSTKALKEALESTIREGYLAAYHSMRPKSAIT